MPKATKPKKLTAQQEAFCQQRVRGFSQAEAYRRSYKVHPNTLASTVWNEASKLASNPTVAARITHLTEQAAKRAGVTRESMLVEMQQNREHALDQGNVSVAATSSRDRARVAGLLKDKLELTGEDGAAIAVKTELEFEERSMNEIARRIAFALQKGKREKKLAATKLDAST